MTRSARLFAALAVSFLATGPAPAFAQGHAVPPTRNPADAVDRISPNPPELGFSGSSSEPLSDKLDRSNGVIRPPAAIDPGIAQPPPAVGRQSTPVIPPPGTERNKPSVEPK
jgi:hypothetical protein